MGGSCCSNQNRDPQNENVIDLKKPKDQDADKVEKASYQNVTSKSTKNNYKN